jgi:hypothetical protein
MSVATVTFTRLLHREPHCHYWLQEIKMHQFAAVYNRITLIPNFVIFGELIRKLEGVEKIHTIHTYKVRILRKENKQRCPSVFLLITQFQ